MSESKGLSHNPLFVAIFSGIVLTGLGALAVYEKLSVPMVIGWFQATGRFFGTDVTIQRWLFWLWLVFTLVISGLTILRVLVALSEGQTPAPATPAKPAAPPFAKYVSDIFFKWRWRWKVDGAMQVRDVTMYCPECDLQMTNLNFGRQTYDRYYCACGNCGYRADTDHSDLSGFFYPVKLAAERMLRTGEWEKTMKSAKPKKH